MAKPREKLKILGVIGVRANSKSIKDKNIKSLGGIPLMGWIIDASKQSKYIDRLIVSTDSAKYAKIAKKFGAEVPFLRPASISRDQSLEIEYLQHAVRWCREKEGYDPDIVVRMQATCPLQLAEDIDACLKKLIEDPKADSAMVVAEAIQHPFKAIRILSDGSAVSFLSNNTYDLTPVNRQSKEQVYFRANIIATRTKVLMEQNSQSGSRVKAHVIPQERAIDINVPVDFLVAEVLLKKYRRR